MPNHCANKLVVSGKSEDLIAFFEKMKGKYSDGSAEELLCLDKVLLMPPELLNGQGWHSWRVDNWGTKWGCYKSSAEMGDDTLTYHFRTAWSPFSYKIFEMMTKMYPALGFELLYAERGMEYLGAYSQKVPLRWSKQGEEITAVTEDEDEPTALKECYAEWQELWDESG